jgi:flagellar biosynthesis GTPase FlhF
VRRFQGAADRRTENPALPYNPRNTFDTPIPEESATTNSSQYTASINQAQSMTQAYAESTVNTNRSRKRAGSIQQSEKSQRKQQRIREMQQRIAEDKLERELEDEMRKRGLEIPSN